MALTIGERRRILHELGTDSKDIDNLLEYTSNVFSYNPTPDNEKFLLRWFPLLTTSQEKGAAVAINQYLVRSDLQIDFKEPDDVKIEIFDSFAGKIPIISAHSNDDFESLVQNIVFKDKPYPHIKSQGAQFVHGKNNRFIILSYKPYSNTPAEVIELDSDLWREKSYTIRKYHECAHLYTKQNFGSVKNNLHDELIADFCGIWAAFSEYRADYFTRFLAQGRLKIYVEGLNPTSVTVIEKLANTAATWIEKWSKSDNFTHLTELERIDFLCKKELLSYVY